MVAWLVYLRCFRWIRFFDQCSFDFEKRIFEFNHLFLDVRNLALIGFTYLHFCNERNDFIAFVLLHTVIAQKHYICLQFSYSSYYMFCRLHRKPKLLGNE